MPRSICLQSEKVGVGENGREPSRERKPLSGQGGERSAGSDAFAATSQAFPKGQFRDNDGMMRRSASDVGDVDVFTEETRTPRESLGNLRNYVSLLGLTIMPLA